MVILLPGALALARCASPDPAIYTLRVVPGTVAAGAPAVVKLARPGLAGYLDRPEIVRDSSSNRLLLLAGERWGEPLGDMVGRVLALDLAQRLPKTSVFTEAGAISMDANVTVEVDILRFDLDMSGVVVLLAQTAIQQRRGSRDPIARSVRLTVPPTGTDTSALVSAMSAALGQLADQVAALLHKVPPTAA